MKNRMPAVAGTFYPATATTLENQLFSFFEKAVKGPETEVAALIVPHAGYIFSGEVAASAYARLDRQKQYQNIFIIGVSHRKHFNGVSVYPKGYYTTPSGMVKVDEAITTQLIQKYPFIYYDEDADKTEHSLEVQLPFLQYWLLNDFQIVPLLLGSEDAALGEKLAEALRPWFNAENLFVISTDFSHYPSYDTAVRIDGETADAILSNDSNKLKTICDKNKRAIGNNVLTGLCGAAAVQILLHLTQGNKEISFEKIAYKNSGDAKVGDKKRVVGYWAIAANRVSNSIILTEAEKTELLKLARASITGYLSYSKGSHHDREYSGTFLEKFGAFVTLKIAGKLRGCIGRFDPHLPLYQLISELAISAATRDSRFDPLTIKELNQIDIEISVLTPLKKIDSIDEIEIGKHGIYIKKGIHSGTFLPQVALETKWTKEELLGHCARDKAGIGWDGWKTSELYTYEAVVFGEK